MVSTLLSKVSKPCHDPVVALSRVLCPSQVQALQEHVFSLERDLHVGRPPRSPAAGHLMSDQVHSFIIIQRMPCLYLIVALLQILGLLHKIALSQQALQTPPRLPQSRLDSLESVKKAEREASHQRAAASALAAANASLDCLQARLHLGSDGGATSGSLDQSEPGAQSFPCAVLWGEKQTHYHPFILFGRCKRKVKRDTNGVSGDLHGPSCARSSGPRA